MGVEFIIIISSPSRDLDREGGAWRGRDGFRTNPSPCPLSPKTVFGERGKIHTGQRQAEAGLYYYVSRWYDPELGRFAQADTIIPQPGNPLAWDRYSYTGNDPVNLVDPSGHKPCGEYCESEELKPLPQLPIILIFGGSNGSDINQKGPNPKDQLPAWSNNPNEYDTQYVRYPGSKEQQTSDALSLDITAPTYLICYSAGAEPCLGYAKTQIESGNEVFGMVLIGPTFTSNDVFSGENIGREGWKKYIDFAMKNGVNAIGVDDGMPLSNADDWFLATYGPPSGSSGRYSYEISLTQHYDSGGIHTGSNNRSMFSNHIFEMLFSIH